MKPTTPGYYWLRNYSTPMVENAEEPTLVRITQLPGFVLRVWFLEFYYGTELTFVTGEWHGPLKSPFEEQNAS